MGCTNSVDSKLDGVRSLPNACSIGDYAQAVEYNSQGYTHLEKFLFILEDDSCRKVFQKFVEHKFSEQHVIFWEAVQDYKVLAKNFPESVVLDRAIEINAKFVKGGTPLEINITSAHRASIEVDLRAVINLPTIFNAVEECVVTLLYGNYFFDFIEDKMYAEWYVETKGRPGVFEKIKFPTPGQRP